MTACDASRVFFIGGERSAPDATIWRVGGKAANLARLDRLGLRVPPALALDVDLASEYARRGALPPEFRSALRAAVHRLEEATGCILGGDPPLVVSVRSSPRASMPGMLESILNVGLSDAGVHGLVRRTGNPWLAWDAYRRLVRAFAATVGHLPSAPFDHLTEQHLARAGARALDELDPLTMRDLASASARLLRTSASGLLPEDPFEQLVAAVEAVLASWSAPRAREYRRLNALDEQPGTGALIQSMVFGNAGGLSGSGVAFTRNPATGEDTLYFDFATNAQGEDVVSGRTRVSATNDLAALLPQVWAELQRARGLLEREFQDMQDFEFTIEDGRLYFLQTRAGKRTPWAALRIAVDLVRDGVLTPDAALQRLAEYDLDRIVRIAAEPRDRDRPLARGTPAGYGVAIGAAAFDSARAREMAADGAVILMRPDISTDEIAGISSAAGVVTTAGGRTSHAAVVARQLGKVALVSCRDLHVDAARGEAMAGTVRIHEGDVVTVDAERGALFLGALPVVVTRPVEALAEVARWREARTPAGTDVSSQGILSKTLTA